jgi:protein ImuB
VPSLRLQRIARGRERGEGEPRPLAVVAEGRVLCADAAARAEGVRPGATAAEALAACGKVELFPVDPGADRAALRALAEALLGLAPAVELSDPDTLLLDASAAHLLAPTPLLLPPHQRGKAGRGAREAEEHLAQTDASLPLLLPPHQRGEAGRGAREAEEHLASLAIAAAAEMGYAARAAIATGRGPARALVHHGEFPTPAPLSPSAREGREMRRGAIAWVPADGTVAALAALPVAALGLGADVAMRLSALGIDRAGALARLPEGTLAHRFGPAGVLAARLARGEDDSPLVPYVPETLPEEALDLEAPAESAEPLLFGLKRLADRVAARLAGRGLGATRLRIVLKLDPRGEERLAVPLASPTASAGRWLLPVKEHLFSMRLAAAVTGLRLAAVEVAPIAPEQLAIGDRPEALAALEGLLSRLAVRLGDAALFAAEPVDRHRPEGAYRAVPFRTGARRGAPGRRGEAEPPDPEEAPPRPTRLLAVPAPVVAEGEGGRLTALRVDGRARAVLALEGPERLRGEWWAARSEPAAQPRSASGAPWGGPFDRDYYRVRLEGLGDCWVFRDGGDGRLYLHGFFD